MAEEGSKCGRGRREREGEREIHCVGRNIKLLNDFLSLTGKRDSKEPLYEFQQKKNSPSSPLSFSPSPSLIFSLSHSRKDTQKIISYFVMITWKDFSGTEFLYFLFPSPTSYNKISELLSTHGGKFQFWLTFLQVYKEKMPFL